MSQPNVSLVTVIHDQKSLYPLIKHHWETLIYPKDKLEWIIIDDSKEDHTDHIPCDENILYIRLDPKEYLDKITFPKDEDNKHSGYWKRINALPDGFKRDYAVGFTSHEYVLHMDIDTLYSPKTIKHKLDFLRKGRLDCVFCNSMLCYDIYNKKLYKTEKSFGYESTLFHTKKFWKDNNGFRWSDNRNEAIAFYHNKGNTRKMDNYYDTIKLLSIHNANCFQPKEVTIENMNIDIPEIVSSISIKEHPLQGELHDLFYGNDINVVSINSEMIDYIKKDTWKVDTLQFSPKEREKVMIKNIKEKNTTYDLCIINTKNPVWLLIDALKFPQVILESERNREQMNSILTKKGYVLMNHVYILSE